MSDRIGYRGSQVWRAAERLNQLAEEYRAMTDDLPPSLNRLIQEALVRQTPIHRGEYPPSWLEKQEAKEAIDALRAGIREYTLAAIAAERERCASLLDALISEDERKEILQVVGWGDGACAIYLMETILRNRAAAIRGEK